MCPFTIPAGRRVSFSIKFVAKMSGSLSTAMLQIRRWRKPRTATGRGISACCFTFLESELLPRCALQRVSQRNIWRPLHKDRLRAGKRPIQISRCRREGRTTRHHRGQFYGKGEQPFQPGARADSVIRHSARVPRISDPENTKSGAVTRFVEPETCCSLPELRSEQSYRMGSSRGKVERPTALQSSPRCQSTATNPPR